MIDAWVLHGKKNIRLEKREIPPINNDEVLIKVKQTGICGSDLAYYSNGKVGDYKPSRPFVLGHEFSGEVVRLGDSVGNVKLRDRVAVDPSMCCGECDYCISGRSNLCRRMKFMGSGMYVPPVDGSFRQYVVMPAKNCFVLPEEISYEIGALLEPMSVAYYALRRAGELKGKSVFISGAGTIGQLVLTFALALGVKKVCITDPLELKREMAKKQGASIALDPLSENFLALAGEMNPGGYDVIIEASGSVRALCQGMELARTGGTVVQVGIPPPEDKIPLGLIFFKELNYTGSFRFCGVFEEVLSLCLSGEVNVKGLISHTFPFYELDKAMAYAIDAEDSFKIQITL